MKPYQVAIVGVLIIVPTLVITLATKLQDLPVPGEKSVPAAMDANPRVVYDDKELKEMDDRIDFCLQEMILRERENDFLRAQIIELQKRISKLEN